MADTDKVLLGKINAAVAAHSAAERVIGRHLGGRNPVLRVF
jgi:hypothetical protein